MTLIAITGRAQHGKDTIGQRLVDHGFARFAFADQLKDLALYINPIVSGDIRDFDEERMAALVSRVGWEEAKKNPEVRRFLQELGTGVRDIIGEDAWVNALEKLWLASGRENVVITDVRFPNEARWVHRHGGQLWRVTRMVNGGEKMLPFDNGVDPNHASEVHVPTLLADHELLNCSDLMFLQAQADELLHEVA